MAGPLILVEAKPRRVDTGAEVTVRLAGGGGAKPYFYDSAHWQAGIDGLPKSVAALTYAGEDLGGGSVPEAMVLSWAAGSSAELAEKSALHWPDAAIAVRIGAEGALPPIVTSGKVLSALADGGVLQIAFADPAADLMKPILTDRYAGTGGLEGPVEWEGKIKRRAWGRLFNVAGDMIDAPNNILCFADPMRPLQSFDAVRDKGAPAAAGALVLLAWQGSAEATFAALQAAEAPQGGGVLCPSISCIKWWTQPAGALCVDLRGEVGAGYVETAGSLASRIAGAVSAVPFAAGAIAAADAARPISVGWLAADETGTAAAALDQLLGDVSLLWLLDSGAVDIRAWEWGASVASARSLSVARKASFRPVARRRLGYRRNLNVMNRDAIAGIVFASDIAFGDGSSLEDLQPAEAGADVTGNNTANDTAHVGGVPAAEVIGRIGGAETALTQLTEDVTAKVAGLDRADVDADAARRQLDAQIAALQEAAMRLVLEGRAVRQRLSDAGIYLDPATAQVRIYAMDQQADRISNAEIRLDGFSGTLLLKADRTWVTQQITEANFDPSQVAELGDLFARVTSTELRLDGAEGLLALKADAVIVNGHSASITSITEDLDALEGVVATKVSSAAFDDLGQRVTDVEQTLTGIGDTVGLSVLVRQAQFTADDSAEGALRSLLAGNDARRRMASQIAEVHFQLTTTMNDGFSAEAAARLSLAAQLGGSIAGLVSTQQALSTTQLAQAQSIANLTASIGSLGDQITGQATTLLEAIADGDEASAEQILLLQADVAAANASIAETAAVAASADGIAKAIRGFALDVSGKISGMHSENDGTVSSTIFRSDVFGVESDDGSFTFINGDMEFRDELGRLMIFMGQRD